MTDNGALGARLPTHVPASSNAVSRAAGRLLLRLAGWKFAGAFPDLPKFVIVVAPHTSNWDFFVGLAAKWALGMEATWVAKHSIFRWPVNRLLRRMGGIPVRRDAAHDVVSQIVAEFGARSGMVLTIAPEGTRRRVTRWRSGYWHIANQAGVPIVPVGFDFGRKEIRIGEPLETTGSRDRDEAALRAFFATVRPRHPANYAP